MKKDVSYPDVIKRIQTATHTRSQTELASLLEISQSSVAEAKRRQAIPADWYLKLFEKLGVNPDWLKKGNGPVYLRTEAGYVPSDGDGPPIDPGLLGSRLAQSGGMNAVVPQNSSSIPAASSPVDAPQVQTITSGRDLLDQAKVLARYLNEQPQGWLSAHRNTRCSTPTADSTAWICSWTTVRNSSPWNTRRVPTETFRFPNTCHSFRVTSGFFVRPEA